MHLRYLKDHATTTLQQTKHIKAGANMQARFNNLLIMRKFEVEEHSGYWMKNSLFLTHLGN